MNTTIIITIIKFVILAFLLYQAYILGKALFERKNNITILAKSTVDTAIGKSKSLYFSDDNIKSMMSKYGLMYMLHDYSLESSTFIIMKIIFGLGIGLAVSSFFSGIILKIVFFLIMSIVGFYLPDEFLKMSNKTDNVNMLDDIVTVYTALKIYTTSNVHITSALIECQRIVSNRRLKEAFMELNNNILSGRITMEDAVDLFNSRFCNDHIDNLSVIIKQSLKTGHSSEILADISKQIEDTNRVRAQDKKKQLERKMSTIQVMFFSCLAAIAIYISVYEMLDTVFTI